MRFMARVYTIEGRRFNDEAMGNRISTPRPQFGLVPYLRVLLVCIHKECP